MFSNTGISFRYNTLLVISEHSSLFPYITKSTVRNNIFWILPPRIVWTCPIELRMLLQEKAEGLYEMINFRSCFLGYDSSKTHATANATVVRQSIAIHKDISHRPVGRVGYTSGHDRSRGEYRSSFK